MDDLDAAGCAPRQRRPILGSRAVRRAEAHGRGPLRPRARARRDLSGCQARRARATAISRLKDESAVIDGVMWKGTAPRLALPARGRARGRSPPASSPPIPAARTTRSSSSGWSWPARARCWRCSKSGARQLAGRGAVRRGAQAAAALPAARDRRRHLADRRGDPRHPPPPGGPLPAPCPRLAGARCRARGARAEVAAAIAGFNALAGRASAAARPADRRARRRLDRGPVGLQRGDRGARRRAPRSR